MGKRTSVYLLDDVAEAAEASGVPLGELVRRGLSAPAPDAALAQLAAQTALLDVADRLEAALENLRVQIAGDVRAVIQDEVAGAVRSALAQAQGGGSW